MDLEFVVTVIIAGVMGSYALLSMALWANQIGLPRLDFSTAMAKLTYGATFEDRDTETPYWPGMIIIIMNGIFFAFLYAAVVAQWIPIEQGPLKGAIWGVVLWFVSGVFFVPVYLKEGFML